ncbi:MAG: methyltransferase domain-containing protein [Nitrososphaerales archaeon]
MERLPIKLADATLKELKSIFDSSEYWEDGTIGYYKYDDFPVHANTIRIILRERPKSVLDVGGGYGYIVRRLNLFGIEAYCADISKYCMRKRVTENFVLCSATHLPFKDKAFDLVISIATMEHIPEKNVVDVIKEMVRVGRRGLHGITFQSSPQDIDITHVNIKPLKYWRSKFPPEHKIFDKEKVEVEKFEAFSSNIYVNIGCHVVMFFGWINIDINDLSAYANSRGFKFIKHDCRKGLPFSDNSVSIINASHFIEHLTYEEAKSFLKECYRVLCNGGIIRLAVPDLKLLAEKYLKCELGEYDLLNEKYWLSKSQAEKFYRIVLEGHKSCWDYESLTHVLEEVGFKDVTKVKPGVSFSPIIEKYVIDTFPTLSLYVEAFKIY